MRESKYFDVVIGGAGIAGLLIASELSRTKKVLVIDSANSLQTNKFWVTLKSCVESNLHLNSCTDSHFESMDFSDAYRNQFRLTGQYVLWDTIRLMDLLKATILKNHGTILFDQRFCGYKTRKDSLEIFANDNTYTAQLFIDCMGHSSPLVLAKNLIQFHGHYLLYGAKLKIAKQMDPICLSNVVIDKKPKYFEVFPTANGDAYATMIYPTQNLGDMNSLAADFKFITRKSVYAEYFEPIPPISKLWGIVPVGTIRRKALDRVLFFGESAQSNPAATGTCLTRLLFSYKMMAKFALEKIDQKDLGEKSLSTCPSAINTFTQKLQLYAFRDILSWNSDRFSKFLKIIDHVDHEIINNFLFGELAAKDLVTKKHLLKLCKPKNFFLTKPLFQTLANSI